MDESLFLFSGILNNVPLCVFPHVQVFTPEGLKSICSVKAGDEILTTVGEFLHVV
jgi:hypothetical protein